MNISENSRIWIYQANRLLSSAEEQRVQQKLNNFTSQWLAHGHALAAQGEIRHSQFIILSVDEEVTGATGCSIDKSVYLMKEIEHEFKLDLFDRFRVAFRDGENIVNCSRHEFEDLLSKGEVDGDTLVFNNMIGKRRELSTSWEIPMKDSWHAKVFEGKINSGVNSK